MAASALARRGNRGARSLVGRGVCRVRRGDPDRPRDPCLEQLEAQLVRPLPPMEHERHERTGAMLSGSLGAGAMSTGLAHGRGMGLDEAVAYALASLDRADDRCALV